MTEYVNKITGEVVKRDFGTPLYVKVPDFEFNSGVSETAPDQVEPLQTIVARCMRGELLTTKGQSAFYDEDMSDAECALHDGYADLADLPSLVENVGAAAAGADAQSESTKVDKQTTNSASETQSTEASDVKSE